MANYAYPLNEDWTTEEMVDVVNLLRAVERAYEEGISVKEFSDKYQKFKQVVTSIGEEKRLGREFEAISGYVLYFVVREWRKIQAAGLPQKTKIRMKQRRS